MVHHLRSLVDRTHRLLAIVAGPVDIGNPDAELERCKAEQAMLDTNAKDVDVYMATDMAEMNKANLSWRTNRERCELYGRLVAQNEVEELVTGAITARCQFWRIYIDDIKRPSTYDLPPVYCAKYYVVVQMVKSFYQIDLDNLANIDTDGALSLRVAMKRRLAMVVEFTTMMFELPSEFRMTPHYELLFTTHIDRMTTMMKAAQQAQLERMKIKCEIVRLQPSKDAEAKADRRAEVAMKAAIGLAEQRKKRVEEEEQKQKGDVETEEEEQMKKRDVEAAAEHRRNTAPILDTDLVIVTLMQQHWYVSIAPSDKCMIMCSIMHPRR